MKNVLFLIFVLTLSFVQLLFIKKDDLDSGNIIDSPVETFEEEEVVKSSATQDKVKLMFKEFKDKNGKKYKDATEEQTKFNNFKNNIDKIEKHNASGKSVKLGLNKFADMSFDEIKEKLLVPEGSLGESIMGESLGITLEPGVSLLQKNRKAGKMHAETKTTQTTANYDWTVHMPPVRDQGMCGCCWAFATAAATSGNLKIATGQSADLSPQHLVDCNTANFACNGGDVGKAIQFIQNNGIAIESNYPYISGNTLLPGTCNANVNKFTRVAGMQSCVNCTQKEFEAMISQGPVVIAVNVDDLFMLYSSGIMEPCSCGATNHAVVAVGTGVDSNGRRFMKILNSWTSGWGEQGYFRMYFDTKCFGSAFAWRPLITPPLPCGKVYSTCDASAKIVDVCDNKLNPSGFENMAVATADSGPYTMRVFTGDNCTGSSYGFFGGKMQCFASPFFQGVRSIVIERETPPDGCAWLFSGRCLTGTRLEVCGPVGDIRPFGINQILSLQRGKGVTSVVLFMGVNYTSSKFTIGSTLYSNTNLDRFIWPSVQLVK